MQMHFNDLFHMHDEMINPKTLVCINGFTFGPEACFHVNALIQGLMLSNLVGKYIEIVQEQDVHIITGYYG